MVSNVAPATTPVTGLSTQFAKFTREQIELIKHTVAVGATDNELALFLYQADKRGLDPLTRQIHFIKRKRYNADTDKYEEVGTIQTGIDGFRVVAGRTGKLAGIKRGSVKDDKGNLISAWAEIYRSDWKEPVREEVSLNEYCQRRKDGEPTGLWKTMPETMLKKVAESSALRMAFPEDLSGIYTNEEMGQADNEVQIIEGSAKEVAPPARGRNKTEPRKTEPPSPDGKEVIIDQEPKDTKQEQLSLPPPVPPQPPPTFDLNWLRESLERLAWADVGKWIKDHYPKSKGERISEKFNSLTVEQKAEFIAEVKKRLAELKA